jgi:diacylglycerol O-acyltransferase-1
VLIGVHIVMGLFQQWMVPSVNNSLVPFSNMDLAKMTERLLKLAVSTKLYVHIFMILRLTLNPPYRYQIT